MKKLHPKALWLFFIRNSIAGIILSIPLGFFIGYILFVLLTIFKKVSISNMLDYGYLIPIYFFGVLVLSYLVALLTYNNYKFKLTQNTIEIERGIIYKRYVSIPFQRIQNVNIYRSLLERVIGISTVTIQTAGRSVTITRRGYIGGPEGVLPGLSKIDAKHIRDDLINRIKKSSK